MRNLFLLYFILTYNTVFSQKAKVINNDSLANWELKKIAHSMALSNEQKEGFRIYYLNFLTEAKNLNVKNLTKNEHSKNLKNKIDEFERMLKLLFTKAQFEQYKNFQKQTENDFMNRQRQNKIKINSIAN